MSAPIVSWYMPDNTTAVVQPYSFGVLDAGTDVTNPVHTFHIWNNRNGSEDVPKMEQCTITTRDKNFGDGTTVGQENPLVKDCWFCVQVDTLEEDDLFLETSKVGKDKLKPLGTNGSTVKDHSGATITAIKPMTQEILGVNNNGVTEDCGGNFVSISTSLAIPITAPSGLINYKLRVAYRYV